MSTARAIFQAHVDGDTLADVPVMLQWFLNPATGLKQQLALSIGNFAFTSPALVPSLFILVPPTNNTVQITIKGINGDTGIPLVPNMPFVYPVPANTAFVVAAGGNVTIEYAFI